MKDTYAEGDGERNDINIKRLLMYFKSHGSFSKYAVEMFTNIAQTKALFSEVTAHRVRWVRFVNWAGRKGKNIECEYVTQYRRYVIALAKMLSLEWVQTKPQLPLYEHQNLLPEQIVTKFDVESKLHKHSTTHTSRSSQDAENVMIKDLMKLQPFHTSPGRYDDSFMNIEASPLVGMPKIFTWLDEHN